MAKAKKLSTHAAQGLNLYVMVRRDLDSYYLNDATGAFVTPLPADPYLALAESASLPGLYEVSESRSAWNPGDYSAVVYSRAGGAPAPATDTVLGWIPLVIRGDQVVSTQVHLDYIQAAIGNSSKQLAALAAEVSAQTAALRLLVTATERNGLRI
jgi:hypothetical protein